MADNRDTRRCRLGVYNARGVPVDLCDLWGRDVAAFLLLGGPSANLIPKESLAARGVLVFAVNNVGGHLPCSAWLMNDPVEKAHHGILLDGNILHFLPKPRMKNNRGKFRIKGADGIFSWAPIHAKDCPSMFFYERDVFFQPETFLSSETASWGTSSKHIDKGETKRPKLLCTMFSALKIMYYLGVRETYLLGADFTMTTKAGYSFGQSRDADAVSANNNLFRTANLELCALQPHLLAGGYRVFNCNRESALQAFPYVPFEKALKRVRGAVPLEPFDLTNWYNTKGQVGPQKIPAIQQGASA